MKKLGIGCGLILLFVVIAGVALTVWARKPAEMLMNKAVADAEKRLQRDITVGPFGGNPFTGFYIRDVTVASKTEGMPDTLHLESLRMRISLPELLKRKIVFRQIGLVRPAVYIERYASGENTVYDIMETLKPAAEQKETDKKKTPKIFFEKIKLQGMTVKLKLHREEGDPVELLFEPIDVTLDPAQAGSYDNFNVKAGATMEGLRVDGSGTLAMSPEMKLDFKWETNDVATDELPPFLADASAAMDKIGMAAKARANGTLTVVEAGPTLDAVVEIEDAAAVAQTFGDGKINANFSDGLLTFTGGIGGKGPSIKTEGSLKTGEEPDFTAGINLAGISVSPALMMFLHDKAPEVFTGTLGGDIQLKGPGFDMKKLRADGNLQFRNGQVNYPTPIPHGTGHGWAPIPYDTIDVSITHTQPNISVKSMRLKGNSINAIGNGTISYTVDKETGAAAGPLFFNVSLKADSLAVEEILALNQYVGRAVSGNLALEGRMQGNTKTEDTLRGNASFAFLDGKIVNPYQEQSSKLPLNANLSHYEFDSLKGSVTIADRVVSTRNIALRSTPIDADLSGTMDFDGALNAHAETSVKPAVLATIVDFQPVIPAFADKLEKMNRVETSFDLGGSLQEPKIDWNAEEFGKMIGKKLMEKKGEAVLDKTLDKIDKKLGGDGDGDVADTVKKKLKDKLKKIF